MTPEEREQFNQMLVFFNEMRKNDFSNLAVFKKNIKFDSTKVGFFGGDPVSQQSDGGAPSISTVSGSGADSVINSNFSSLQAVVNNLRSTLSNLNLHS